MTEGLNEEITRELQAEGPMSERLKAELMKLSASERAKRRKERSTMFESRFRTFDGKPGLRQQWPDPNYGPPPSAAHNYGPPPPPPLQCAPGFNVELGRQMFNGVSSGSVWVPIGSADEPDLGPEVVPPYPDTHIYSILTRPPTGEISLAAATYSPAVIHGYYQPLEQLALGAEGVQVAGSILQGFYLPNLPHTPPGGYYALSASARLTAPNRVSPHLTVVAEKEQSFAGIYGFVTITLYQGLIGNTAKSSAWKMILKRERANGIDISNDMPLDLGPFGPVDISTMLPYNPKNGPLLVVEVEVSIACAILLTAITKEREGALCNMRFGDDDRLMVLIDYFNDANTKPPSNIFRVEQIKLCGAIY